MKTRGFIIVICLFLFSSCIVKSIQPFYTQSAIKYNPILKGDWRDSNNGKWKIVSFKEEWEKENDPNTKLTKEDREAYKKYKDAYYIQYIKKESEAAFIAMPFTVNEHLFIDLTPFEYDSSDLNKLVAQHLLKTHSTAYVKINDDNTIKLKWLSEKAVGSLIRNKKLRLKYESTGIDEDLVLTAKSEELHAFLEKFMSSEFEDKWDKDDIYTLTPSDAKP